jgi:hypothetical protein
MLSQRVKRTQPSTSRHWFWFWDRRGAGEEVEPVRPARSQDYLR